MMTSTLEAGQTILIGTIRIRVVAIRDDQIELEIQSTTDPEPRLDLDG